MGVHSMGTVEQKTLFISVPHRRNITLKFTELFQKENSRKIGIVIINNSSETKTMKIVPLFQHTSGTSNQYLRNKTLIWVGKQCDRLLLTQTFRSDACYVCMRNFPNVAI